MKNRYIVFFFLFLLLFQEQSFCQITIQMEQDGGVYRIPCLVNGAKMKFIFDTGASTVCLSESMAEYLLDNDYLSFDDFTGTSKSMVADGRIVNNLTLVIRDIEISGLHLKNVDAVVTEGQKAPLLLGLSAINKLGKIEIQGNTLVISNGESSISRDVLRFQYAEKANALFNDKIYSEAFDYYEKAYSLGSLDHRDLYRYIVCCNALEQDEKALSLVKDIDINKCIGSQLNVYGLLGDVYYNNMRYDAAVAYYKKALDLQIINESYSEKVLYALVMGKASYEMGKYEDALKGYSMALELKAKALGVDSAYLSRDLMGGLKKGEKSYRDDEADLILYSIYLAMYRSGRSNNSSFTHFICKAAQIGNRYAVSFCNDNGIDYMRYLRDEERLRY